jgi:hypothetical protein
MPRTPPLVTAIARPVMTRADVGEMLAAAGPGVFFLEYQHDRACPGRRTGQGCTCTPLVLLRDERQRVIAEVRG